MRHTPEEDVERLAERLMTNSGNSIIDRDTFDISWDSYMQEDKDIPTLRNKVWKVIRTKQGVSRERIHKKAGGKSLKLDRLRTSKHVVTKRKDYKDARRQDLKGFDTKTYKGKKGLL